MCFFLLLDLFMVTGALWEDFVLKPHPVVRNGRKLVWVFFPPQSSSLLCLKLRLQLKQKPGCPRNKTEIHGAA